MRDCVYGHIYLTFAWIKTINFISFTDVVLGGWKQVFQMFWLWKLCDKKIFEQKFFTYLIELCKPTFSFPVLSLSNNFWNVIWQHDPQKNWKTICRQNEMQRDFRIWINFLQHNSIQIQSHTYMAFGISQFLHLHILQFNQKRKKYY